MIHKRVKMFSQSCNTTSIEDMDLGALAEFGKLHKKMERGEWLKMTWLWVDRPTPKDKGQRKTDGNRSGYCIGGGGCGRDTV